MSPLSRSLDREEEDEGLIQNPAREREREDFFKIQQERERERGLIQNPTSKRAKLGLGLLGENGVVKRERERE